MRKVLIFTFFLHIIVACSHAVTQTKNPQQLISEAEETDFVEESDKGIIFEARGCCSYHNGVCGCQNGRAICCDGQYSPSCGC